MKTPLYISLIAIILSIGAFIVALTSSDGPKTQMLGSANNTFPTTLNDWEEDDTIESEWADSLEIKMGVDNSTNASSIDYQIKSTNAKLGSIYNTATTSDWVLVADGKGWNATSSLIIDNNGYVGIGTTTPMNLFSITGNSRMSGDLAVTGNITGTFTGTAGSYLLRSNWFSTTTLPLSVTTASNLSITMSQISDFDISDISLTSKYMIIGNSSNQASSTSAMIVDTNGYVGISTSTPSRLFSVGGESYFNGALTLKNGTSTLDRLLVIDSNSPDATSTGFYLMATQGFVTQYTGNNDIKYVTATNTDAHDHVGTSWADWDVSTTTPVTARFIEVLGYQTAGSTGGVRKDGSSVIRTALGTGVGMFTMTVEASSTTRIIEIYNLANDAGKKSTYSIMGYWVPNN